MDFKVDGFSSSPSSSTTREEVVIKRLKKKIKIKFKFETSDEGGAVVNQESTEKVCEICNKVFSSAKALGGHIKVHYNRAGADDDDFDDADLNTNLSKLKPKSKKIEKREAVKMMGGTAPTCVLCGKRFPSMKSLFGHMRCHPDREWRGIHPPGSSSEIKQEDDRIGKSLPFELPSWPSSAKRSRSANFVSSTTDSASASASASDEQQPQEDLIQAVCGLMYLSRGASPPFGSPIESSNIRIPELKKRSPAEDFENRFDEDLKGVSDEHPLASMFRKKKKTLKEVAGDLQVGYTCSICNKCFPTHQALGGHRSSHNKCIAAPPAEEEAVNSLLLGLGGDEVESSAGSKQLLYKCNICDKSFPSGQALGGHKRCHFNGPAIVENEASPLTTTTTILSSVASKEGEEEASRKRLDFDLNELPVMDDEERQMFELNVIPEKSNEHVSSSCGSAT